jgi:hypothetical protein
MLIDIIDYSDITSITFKLKYGSCIFSTVNVCTTLLLHVLMDE